MVMIAVEDFDVDACLGHPAREQTELAGDVLLQALNENLSFRKHADSGRFESRFSGGSVREKEMGDASAIDNPGATSLDAHAGMAQRLTHFGQSPWAVFEGDCQVFHRDEPLLYDLV
jgi:hypothetical protein